MMRTTILVTVLLVSMLSASAVYAQRVETDLVDGHPVINCDRMPSSMYTTTAKGNTEAVLKTAAANEKVYKRFAVHKSDNSASSSWHSAFTVCSSVSGDGWRLPTQREFMLMWVLKRELDKTSGFIPFSTTIYWLATEYEYSSGWIIKFYINMGLLSKSQSCYVRCVRDLSL